MRSAATIVWGPVVQCRTPTPTLAHVMPAYLRLVGEVADRDAALGLQECPALPIPRAEVAAHTTLHHRFEGAVVRHLLILPPGHMHIVYSVVHSPASRS